MYQLTSMTNRQIDILDQPAANRLHLGDKLEKLKS